MGGILIFTKVDEQQNLENITKIQREREGESEEERKWTSTSQFLTKD